MPNVGTITGSMYLDPSAYISGLNSAAGATQQFQQGVSTVSFAGFNRGIFATTTLLYGLERIMSNMSKGMEEYANMLGRIGTVADLTAASVSALADSMKSISVYQGVSRTDIMGGMYTAAQAGYSSPAEMRTMASSGARLSRASGKEIDVKKSVDLQSGIRQALGIGMDAVSSNRMNDILLKGRDVGRWELDQMAHALGIPLTVWGNQFAGKQDGEETLRQLLAVMSVASLAGVSPNMTATGTRRIVEKTVTLANSGKKGDPLRKALRGVGFTGQDPIMDALNEGGMKYLNTLMQVSNNGETGELTRLGYGSRDLLVLTSALRGKGQKLNEAYEEMSYGNVVGTTDKYGEKMRQTYDYSRDRLRSEWQITSQEFMKATIPLIGQFVNMLESLNSVAQSLPSSVKSLMLFLGAMAAARLALNFAGFRSSTVMPALGGGLGGGSLGALGVGSMGGVFQGIPLGGVAAARLARAQASAAGRPYSRYLTPQSSPMWDASSAISGNSPNSLAAMSWLGTRPSSGIAEDMRMEALRNRYAYGSQNGIPTSSSRYGPSVAARIRWEAYKRGESVDFGTGSYGSLSPAIQAYYANRGQGAGSLSVRELRRQALAIGNSRVGMSGAIIGNISNQIGSEYATPSFARQVGRYGGASAAFAAGGISPTSAMYRDMGINGSAQAVGMLTGKVVSFGSAVGQVLGPLLKFGAVLGALGMLIEGWTYRGRGGPDHKVGGLGTWENKDVSPGVLNTVGLGYKMAGSFARNGFEFLGDMRDEYAEKHGYVSDENSIGKKWDLLKKGATLALTANPTTSMLGLSMLRGSAGKTLYGLEGYRKGNMDDAMRRLSRENLSPGQVAKMRAGGIDFDKFSSAKGYVEKYMRSQLNMNVPDNWESWIQGDQQGGTQILEDALKFSNEALAKVAAQKSANAKAAGNVLTSKNGTKYIRAGGSYSLIAPPVKAAQQSFGRPDWGKVAAEIPPGVLDQLVSSRLLSGRQWDIYSGSDYSGRGNGGLNWNAGGRDYRVMYGKEMDNLDSRFGGFTDQSYSKNIRDPLSFKGGGLRALMGTKGQFDDQTELGFMLDQGDADFAKMKRYKEVLRQMPNIGTMSEAEQMALFTKMSGRDLKSDVYAKADFDNFRNFDMSKIATVEQVKPPVQYASATQFGTAEAYNQLLTRPDASEKMSIAVDKWIAYADSQSVKKADIETELQAVAKAALKFFGQKNVEEIGNNLAAIAGEAAEGFN